HGRVKFFQHRIAETLYARSRTSTFAETAPASSVSGSSITANSPTTSADRRAFLTGPAGMCIPLSLKHPVASAEAIFAFAGSTSARPRSPLHTQLNTRNEPES